MRLGYLLHAGKALAPGSAALPSSSSLQAGVEDYVRFVSLLHSVADAQTLQMCCINLENLREQQPPDDMWAQVPHQMQHEPQQQAAISVAFEVYTTARKPVVQQLHSLAAQLHCKLGSLSAAQGGWAPGVYDLATAQEADSVLQQMSRCTTQLRELSRSIVWVFLKNINMEQNAISIVAAWPFLMQPVPICEQIARIYEQRQQQGRPRNDTL